MPRITVGTIVKLILVSLVVGLALKTLNIDPRSILTGIESFFEWLVEIGGDFFAWAVAPIMIGAVVVIPIWLILYLLRAARGRQ